MENPFGKTEGVTIWPPEPSGEPIKEEVKELVTKLEDNKLSRKMQILAEHGGLESNVPVNSPYWKLK